MPHDFIDVPSLSGLYRFVMQVVEILSEDHFAHVVEFVVLLTDVFYFLTLLAYLLVVILEITPLAYHFLYSIL